MKQEKGKTFNNISTGVNSTRSKFKRTTIITSIKNAPLTAKVNSTWNNVLNKNKDSAIEKTSSSNKFEINLAKKDPMKTLGYFIIDLKNKMDILLPGNRAVKNIMDNILKTFYKMEQPFKIQNTLNNTKAVKSQFSNPHSPSKSAKDVDIDELRQTNVNLSRITEENLKLKKRNEDMEAQILLLTTELNASQQRNEKLESTLNESVNTERKTIANYEHQCKRLQNEIKTLQDSASQKGCSDPSALDQNQKLHPKIAIDKFKYQIQMAFKQLEKEKLMTILKYDENQMNASYSEFCDVYKLIQNYFSSDHSQEMQIFNGRLDKNK